MSFHLLNLPVDVIVYVFGEWLSLVSIATLDTAISNRVIRLEYLKLIASAEFVYFGEILRVKAHKSNDKEKWISKKKIKLGKIAYDGEGTTNSVGLIQTIKPLSNCLKHFEWCTIDDKIVPHVGRIISNLNAVRTLNLTCWKSEYLTMWSFVSHLSELLLFGVGLSSHCLIAIGTHCVRIKLLEFASCGYVKYSTFPENSTHFESLESLRADTFPIEAIDYLIRNAQGLKCIRTAENVAPLLSKYNCKNLTDLDVIWRDKDVNEDLTKIFMQSPKLIILNLYTHVFKVSDNCIKAIGYCPNIVDLFIGYNETQCEAVAYAVSQLKKLKRIVIAYNIVLEAVMANCPLVDVLLASDIQYDNSDILTRLPRSFPLLRRLSINHNKGNNELLVELGKHCPSIDWVNFAGCKDLTDYSVLALLKGCRNMYELLLNSAILITDKTIEAIVAYDNLSRVVLHGDNLSPAGYRLLCQSSPKLSEISLSAANEVEYNEEIFMALKELKLTRQVELNGYNAFVFDDDDDEDDESEASGEEDGEDEVEDAGEQGEWENMEGDEVDEEED